MDCSGCYVAAWSAVALVIIMCVALVAMCSSAFTEKVPMWLGVLICILGIVVFFAMRLGLDYCPEVCLK